MQIIREGACEYKFGVEGCITCLGVAIAYNSYVILRILRYIQILY